MPDPWDFGLVLTVCDQAKAACPAYPAETQKRHVSFPDPTGKPLEEWRKVRDALEWMCRHLVEALREAHRRGVAVRVLLETRNLKDSRVE
ncbi:hypothetical protein L6232_21885, partial [Shewanella sp. C31]|nr:hypothetical protein [Shewanella electrica]